MSRYNTSNPDVYSSSVAAQAGAVQGSSTTSSTTSQTTRVNEDYMSNVGRQALDSLLAQLAAGGTPAQRAIQEDILRTIQQTEAQRAEYSKSAAFADAEGLMQQQLRQALEATLPSILLAGEAAGTSGSAISALLAQDLTARASEGAAAQGLNAAVDYGNISNQLLQTQAELVNREDPALQALQDALAIDRGSVKRGTTKTTSRTKESSKSKSSESQVKVASGAQTSDPSTANTGQFHFMVR